MQKVPCTIGSTVHSVCSMGLEVTERSSTVLLIPISWTWDISRVQSLSLCLFVFLSPLELGLGSYNWGLINGVCSVQFSCSVVSDSLWPHGLQQVRLPCHPTISSSVIPFSSHLQSVPASGSFPMSWFFKSGGQSIGVSASASALPINIQDWFPLGRTCLISLQSKGISRIVSNTTV